MLFCPTLGVPMSLMKSSWITEITVYSVPVVSKRLREQRFCRKDRDLHTYGLIHAASTKPAAPNYLSLLTRCTDGISKRKYASRIFQMSVLA
ncbi:hypothetical protein CGCA056_v010914 [Colletotrichum aenigma]|uniref:uncharacterized protein n=1 Tax=Colletotrichum aenigma TaxID=1215731 RepID=UPI00187313E2|nr:uncharacterized protein CGCA056_v010914 [Colletotrichum aenigma]KAF5518272.1 hypothetical protein CGCA056_v010914 [Colletotrichum aenigma]